MIAVDIAVIGSGSGNSLVTPELAGRRFAIIEDGVHFGGTCLNVGCIPTKMFVHAADVAADVRDAGRLGVDATLDGVRWADVRDRVFGRIDPIAESGEEYRRDGEDTVLLRGTARFTGPRDLAVTMPDGSEERVVADQVVIAAGARPTLPPAIAGAAEREGVELHTSDTVMRLPELPRRMLVVGGGFVAAEMAHVFASFGTQVTLAVRGERLLSHLDEEISQVFTEEVSRRWDVRCRTEVSDLSRAEGDGVRAHLSDGSEIDVDVVLVATGRRPNSDRLDLDAAGVETHEDGRVVVDEHGRTAVPGVWALGDVSSPFMLKHVANQEARVVAHNLAHPDDLQTFDHEHVPSAIFSHPQVATVGMTEVTAREAGHDVVAFTQRYGDTAWGWALEDESSICTVVACRRTGELLGAHILGPDAAILIQPLVQALATGQPVADLARGQYWIHPAPTEVVENALLGLDLNPVGDLTESPPDA